MSLLLAALAYLVGVAGPGLHTHGEASRAVAALSAPQEESRIPLPDAERGCFVCQVLGAAGLPALTVRLPEATVRLVAASSPFPQRLSHREPAPARARAPPPLHFL